MMHARFPQKYAHRRTLLDALHSERTSTHAADRTLCGDLEHIVLGKKAVFGKRTVYFSDEFCAPP